MVRIRDLLDGTAILNRRTREAPLHQGVARVAEGHLVEVHRVGGVDKVTKIAQATDLGLKRRRKMVRDLSQRRKLKTKK